MKDIRFSKEQFQRLLELVYLGNWMISAHNTHVDYSSEYETLERFLFTHAKDFELDHLAIIDSNYTGPSADLEEDPDLRSYIDEYDNETFWIELCDRLARKKFFQTYSKIEIEKMDRMERFNTISNFEDQYRLEFLNHSLDNLDLVNLEG